MQILNAGSRVVNTYLYPIKHGYVMIDTGYENTYPAFVRRLSKLGVRVSDIQYVFLTHAHDDHAGFLRELLEQAPHIRVVASQKAVPSLCKGQNSFVGGCSSRLALGFCHVMKLLGRGEHKFPSIHQRLLERFLLVTEEDRATAEAVLGGEILFTPGHTADSITLGLPDGSLFCGDAAMNGFPSLHHITIWVENKEDYENTWQKIISSGPKMIYPAHGSPFLTKALEKEMPQAKQIHLYPLK